MRTRAQSIIEYAIIIAVVGAALTVMQIYIRRAVQSSLKPLDDQLSPKSARYVVQ